MRDSEALLSFWFGDLGDDGVPEDPVAERWFESSPGFDAELRERFGGLAEAALAGELEDWSHSLRGRLALVLLLDQLTRNLFRGEAAAFSADDRARALVEDALEQGIHHTLRPIERSIFYLPFMHAEDRAAQERSVALYTELAAESPPALAERLNRNLDFAKRHQSVIALFGRFPSRNEALGRESTDAESAFLAEHPSGF